MDYYGSYPNNPGYFYPQKPHAPRMVPKDKYTYPHNLPMALKVIRETVEDQKEKAHFYGSLMDLAPSEEDKLIIKRIKDTEAHHIQLLNKLYYELTGQMLPPPHDTTFKKLESYCQGLKRALFEEAEAIEQHRMILFALQDRRHINMLTEIITDEIKHADFFNLLYAKNACFQEEKIEKKI